MCAQTSPWPLVRSRRRETISTLRSVCIAVSCVPQCCLGPRRAPVAAPLAQHVGEHALDAGVIEGVALTDFAALDQAADHQRVVRFQFEDTDAVALARAMPRLTAAVGGTACIG